MKRRGFLATITAGMTGLVTSKYEPEGYFKSDIIDRSQEHVAPDTDALELYNNDIISCSGVCTYYNVEGQK